MTRYIGILEQDPGTLWGIYFPDLPGCVTAGETAEEALSRAPEALRLWVEDALDCREQLPTARSVEELRRDPDISEALSLGRAAAVVFSLTPEEETFDAETLKAIDRAAKQRGVSRSAFLRQTVLEKIAG
jgi:predicted RNase H-like HicB family nuclease